MKLSYNWLKQYIDLSLSPEELAEKITMAGLEVEDIVETGSIPNGVVVAEILERSPHPNADKLSVCRVSTGQEEFQVVCGAPNCDTGVKAPLATLGTEFVDEKSDKPFIVKKCKLRGVESFGMICSSRELGIDDDHEGIMVLPNNLEVGTAMSDVHSSDTVFDVEITPNRPDLLSHWGVARDIAALLGKETNFPEYSVPAPAGDGSSSEDLVKVDDFELCPRYTARIIRGVKVVESPDWLKERLISIGLRPINNVVDITNFVLHELGHPLHAFDLGLLSGPKIIVRRAKNGEKLRTLDESECELNDSNLVIADTEKAVALAGVMGGEHSGVTETTTDILLESAMFAPDNIRATAKALGISTDSSYRFERGVDFDMVENASDRASALILELAGGEVATDLVDVRSSRPEKPGIPCDFNRVRNLLGVAVPNERIVEIFQALNLDVTENSTETCLVKAPIYRHDLEREADLVEEVMRIHGLDQVPEVPVKVGGAASIWNDPYTRIQATRDELIGLGLDECIHYTLTDEGSALRDSSFDAQDLISLSNPISIDQAVLRPSLFNCMLETVKRNIARKNVDLSLFEIGLVFCANSEKYSEERREVCIALTGRRHPERFSTERKDLLDFYDLKGLLEQWLDSRRITKFEFKQSENANFAPGKAASLIVNGRELGVFGQVADNLVKDMRIQYPLFMALIQLDKLLAVKIPPIRYESLTLYPATSRDVAFIADEALEHQQIMNFIKKAKVKNLESVELFDIFRDKNLGSNKKSMAYSLTFRNPERTLTDKEVNVAHEKLRSRMAQELQLELR